ncbi:MAG: murein biosynthesis integral membrane protein MurJ [Alphaproteobacteria bacterium]|nr:murein biosynthesis integral membrane protein MurJ [Alphaproteobacteria bacterium]
MALLRAAATVGGYTMASRVLGFVRDLAFAALLGAGPIADAFLVAFRLPNLFRRLFAEGAFAAAFVPMFSSRLQNDGRKAALAFGEEVLAVLFAALLVFTALAEAFMPILVAILAPGFLDQPERFGPAVLFSRLTFPYLLCMALLAFFAGILNSFYRFAIPSAAPILLNVVLIAALATSALWTGAPGLALAIGVCVAGFGQLALILWDMRRARLRLRLRRPRLTRGVRRLLRLLVPGTLSAGALQINLLIGTIIASLLPTGAVAWLHYADRVYQLPLGVVGIALGTALLPRLTRTLQAGDSAGAASDMNRAIEIAMLLSLPAAAALIAMPEAVAGALFERGAFSPADTRATAAAIAAFAAGLPAFVLVRILQPGFFAREDMRTPLRITVVAVLLNTGLSLALYRAVGHVGIAAATSAAAWANAALLWTMLRRRNHCRADKRLLSRLPRSAAAALIMAAALLAGLEAVGSWLAGGEAARVGALALLCGGGLAVFMLTALGLGAVKAGEVRRLISSRSGPAET